MVGLNHGCFSVAARYDGDDLLPLLDELDARRDREVREPWWDGLLRLAVTVRAVPADYMAYYYYRDTVLEHLRGKPTTRSQDIMGMTGGYWRHYEEQAARADPQLDPDLCRGGIDELELAVDVMDAVFNDRDEVWPVNVPNNGTIAELPDRQVVEVPGRCNASGIHPEGRFELPPPVRGLVKSLAEYQLRGRRRVGRRPPPGGAGAGRESARARPGQGGAALRRACGGPSRPPARPAGADVTLPYPRHAGAVRLTRGDRGVSPAPYIGPRGGRQDLRVPAADLAVRRRRRADGAAVGADRGRRRRPAELDQRAVVEPRSRRRRSPPGSPGWLLGVASSSPSPAACSATPSFYANPATVLFWIDVWVGVAVMSALFGNVWDAISPLNALGRVLEQQLARDGITPRAYPAWLGMWPAVLQLLAIAWLELCWTGGSNPAYLAVVIAVYLMRAPAGDGRVRRGGVAGAGRAVHRHLARALTRFAPVEIWSRTDEPCQARRCTEQRAAAAARPASSTPIRPSAACGCGRSAPASTASRRWWPRAACSC